MVAIMADVEAIQEAFIQCGSTAEMPPSMVLINRDSRERRRSRENP